MKRVIALGASNLTRALYTVFSLARAASDSADFEFIAACGVGRSYGGDSRILGRGLPGILPCGLWRALESSRAAPAATVGLVTDVGNDIFYGYDVDRILAFVTESLDRLERHAATIVVAGLPVEGRRTISPAQFRFLTTVIAPSLQLDHAETQARGIAVNAALRDLATHRGHRFMPLDGEWYGFDPIHIQHRFWRTAWARLLGVPADLECRGSVGEALRLHLMRPEGQSLFGVEMRSPQRGRSFPYGGRVWLF